MNAILSEKGQVTIPKKLRESLGLTTGTILDFEEQAGRLVARKVLPQDTVAKWKGRGSLPGSMDVDSWLRTARAGNE